MIVKFLGNKGGGSAKATIDYLLGKDRDRSGAVLLSGDPDLTQRLADNLEFQNRYTVGVLSFEEKQIDEHQKQQIMQSFEETLLAGLERDQYDITWIEHTDKGRLELNFVIPNVELSTGKRLQPYFDQADRPLVENWKQVTNFNFGLSDPHAPEKAQAIKTLNSQNLPENIKEIKQQIGTAIAEQISNGNIQNRQDVVQTLKNAGFEIARETEKSISIKNPDGKRNIRLEGIIYENRQFDQQFAEEHSRAGQNYQRTSQERYATALGKLHSLVESKQQGNREHFAFKPEHHQRTAAENQKRFAFEYVYGNRTGAIDYNFHRISSSEPVVRQNDQRQTTRTGRNQSTSRTNAIGETDFKESPIPREFGQENLLHHRQEQPKSQSLHLRGQSHRPELNQIKPQLQNPFENAFNRADQGGLLQHSELLFKDHSKAQPKAKTLIESPTLEQDNAKRLFESIQRIIELVRTAIERAKRNQSKTERADRNLERSESSLTRSERAIDQSKSAIKQSEYQIKRSEQQINQKLDKQHNRDNNRGWSR